MAMRKNYTKRVSREYWRVSKSNIVRILGGILRNLHIRVDIVIKVHLPILLHGVWYSLETIMFMNNWITNFVYNMLAMSLHESQEISLDQECVTTSAHIYFLNCFHNLHRKCSLVSSFINTLLTSLSQFHISLDDSDFVFPLRLSPCNTTLVASWSVTFLWC